MPFTLMGVINLTPDSFSDPGHNQKKQLHLESIEACKKAGAIPDIGAESTAPFNTKIEAEQEKERLEKFFFSNWDHYKNFPVISFDTYRASTFEWICKELELRSYSGDLVWNDVSGKLDEQWEELAREFNFQYVFSHNLAPSRELTNFHQDYLIAEEDFLAHFKDFFKQGMTRLKKFFPVDRFYLDPCFGFSKTREQNWQLINNSRSWLEGMSGGHKWLLGLSRKSFLHPVEGKDYQYAQRQHLKIVQSFKTSFPNQHFLLRVHKPLEMLDIINA